MTSLSLKVTKDDFHHTLKASTSLYPITFEVSRLLSCTIIYEKKYTNVLGS